MSTDTNTLKTIKDVIDHRILEERKVFLWGMVDDKSSKEVIDRLLYLEFKDPGKDIYLYINSPGGYVTAGFAIYDAMQAISSPVGTVCMGMAASMGSILLSGGAKGKRYIYKHSKVMIHQPSGGTQGTSSDLQIHLNEILKTKELGAKVLADNCEKKIDKVKEDFDRDYWMDAGESVKYGIVDHITEKIA
jgi:ATP-dependent Clp protease protease subunit